MPIIAIVAALFIPIVGLILGIVCCIKCNDKTNKTLSIAAIVIAVLSWIFTTVIMMM